MTPEKLDPVGAARVMEFVALAPAHLNPSDIAALALFLASDESRHVNGAVIPADAGWAAIQSWTEEFPAPPGEFRGETLLMATAARLEGR